MAYKILLVDDNTQTRTISRTRLAENGYEVDEAGNGLECLKKVKESAYDLVILDLMMPILDGFKVLQMIKSDPALKGIPVIVLSGRGQPEEVDKALKLGASDFLIKLRTNPNILLDKVRSTLRAKSGGATVPHYLLAVKELIYDAPKLSKDFNLPADFKCPVCANPLLLELVPDFSHHEPWFSGHFICPQCRR